MGFQRQGRLFPPPACDNPINTDPIGFAAVALTDYVHFAPTPGAYKVVLSSSCDGAKKIHLLDETTFNIIARPNVPSSITAITAAGAEKDIFASKGEVYIKGTGNPGNYFVFVVSPNEGDKILGQPDCQNPITLIDHETSFGPRNLLDLVNFTDAIWTPGLDYEVVLSTNCPTMIETASDLFDIYVPGDVIVTLEDDSVAVTKKDGTATNNWFAYITYTGEEKTVGLYAGQNKHVGTATISQNENGDMFMTINMDPGFGLAEIHYGADSNLGNIAKVTTNKKGKAKSVNIVPGQLPQYFAPSELPALDVPITQEEFDANVVINMTFDLEFTYTGRDVFVIPHLKIVSYKQITQ